MPPQASAASFVHAVKLRPDDRLRHLLRLRHLIMAIEVVIIYMMQESKSHF
jgi:hypothetical protein